MTDALARLTNALADRYQLDRELGRGGMAVVYLAHDLRHDRSVALKVLHPELAQTLGPERFQREIKLAARLQHPHILTVLDSGETAGQLWFTMPYIEGESLHDRLRREKQLPLDEALRIAQEAADALDYAHRHGVIHRDIKPENILLSEGHALVADFGIALAVTQAGAGRLTETGLSLGTPAYMSPEQAMAEADLDARTDQYSLACVLYEMLAGEPPYVGPTAQAIIAKRLNEPVPHLSTIREVPAHVELAMTRALAKTRVDRFPTVAEFSEASRGGRLVSTPARRSTRAWALAAALGILSVVTVGLVRARRDGPLDSKRVVIERSLMGKARERHFDQFRAHTQLKHGILQFYLESWVRKLLLRPGGGDRAYLMDAFAGEGMDEQGNHGSPVISARVAAAAEAEGLEVARGGTYDLLNVLVRSNGDLRLIVDEATRVERVVREGEMNLAAT
jgi:serine/threonine protein kinase